MVVSGAPENPTVLYLVQVSFLQTKIFFLIFLKLASESSFIRCTSLYCLFDIQSCFGWREGKGGGE